MSHAKGLVSGVTMYWNKMMNQEADVTPNDSGTISSTTTSEVVLVNSARNSSMSCSTICPRRMEIDKSLTSSYIDLEVVLKNQTKKDSKERTVIDIHDQSNASNATLENMIRQLGESINSELRQISNRLDELQKENDREKKDSGAKFDCLNQKVDKLDERRIQAKNYHHELRRRFECFENKVNKNYLK